MKNIKGIAGNLGTVIIYTIFITFSQMSFGQSMFDVKPFEKRHFYLQGDFYKNKDFAEVSPNQDFQEGKAWHNALKLIAGFQVNQYQAIELSHIRQSLWMTSQLTNERFVNSRSRSTIDYFSLSQANSIPLYNDRLKLKTSIGYTLGRTKQGKILGSSTTTGLFDGSGDIIESTTITRGLETGFLHFVNFGLGLDFSITHKISLCIGYNHIKGFKDLIQQDVNYVFNGNTGEYAIVSDGSIGGLTLGLKYSFKQKQNLINKID